MENYFYGNMCTHIHIPLNLWCLYCCGLSSLSFDSHHLHEDEIIFVLQLVEWIVYFIISVCGMYEVIFAYLLSFSFFSYLLICHLLMQYISFIPFLFVDFLRKFRLKLYRWAIYRYIIYYCVIFCIHIFIHMFCCCMRYFQCFSSPFFAVHLYTFTWQCKALVT